MYFNVDKVGADVFAALDRGATAGETVEGLLARYEGNRDDVARAVDQFLEELRQERLIVSPPEGEREAPAVQSRAEADPVSRERRFEPPVLHKYTDVQDLLVLDPIHDVDETGWPKPLAAVERGDTPDPS